MNTASEKKGIVVTCVQPTGTLHLGNYFGAIKNWIQYLDHYDCLFGIVDMHAMTIPYTPADLRHNTLACAAQYVACGLDPNKCSIFIQSHIPQHTELMWILSCLTPLGQLERMTQFKDKAKRQGLSVNAGLLYYPVLQAADVLLYNADTVPVGEDQKQHLELARDLAQKFNQTYSETFKLPNPVIHKFGSRIMSLQNPTKKMSKSDENQQGVLYLWDEPAVIRKKIMSAVTDSGNEVIDHDDKPGIKNLLTIMSLATGRSIDNLVQEFQKQGYGTFKAAVAEGLIKLLHPLQEHYQTLSKNKDELLQIVHKGTQHAKNYAQRTMTKVYRKVGCVDRNPPSPAGKSTN